MNGKSITKELMISCAILSDKDEKLQKELLCVVGHYKEIIGEKNASFKNKSTLPSDNHLTYAE